MWKYLARVFAIAAVGVFAMGDATAKEVIIGYTGPLSGGAAVYGKNALSGMEMAAKELNADGGIKVGTDNFTFKIVSFDDQYSPSTSGVNGKRLSAQYKARIVFVSHSAGASALQAFNEKDNFLIAAYTSVPAVSERGNPLTFRIPPSFPVYIPTFVETQMKRYGKKLAIATADHEYARSWIDAFVPAWEAAGGTVISTNVMSYNNDSDFYSGVSRAIAGKPDVMLVGGPSEPTALVIRQARELGYRGGFALLDQAKMDEMARVLGGLELLNGSVGAMPLISDLTPEVVGFVQRYRKFAGKDPTSEAGYNYTALHVLAEAMKRAGTVTEPKAIFAKVNEAFAALPVDRNPSHITGLRPDGSTIMKIRIGEIEKGQVVPIAIVSSSKD